MNKSADFSNLNLRIWQSARRLLCAVFAACAIGFAAGQEETPAVEKTYVWKGADGVWDSANSAAWEPKGVPGRQDAALLAGLAAGARTIHLEGEVAVGGFQMESNGAFTNKLNINPRSSMAVVRPVVLACGGDAANPGSLFVQQRSMSRFRAQAGLSLGKGSVFVGSLNDGMYSVFEGDIRVERGGELRIYRTGGFLEALYEIQGSVFVGEGGLLRFAGQNTGNRLKISGGDFIVQGGAIEMILSKDCDAVVGDDGNRFSLSNGCLRLVLKKDFDPKRSYRLFRRFAEGNLAGLQIVIGQGKLPARYMPQLQSDGVLRFIKLN